METILRVENLTKKYNNFTALDRISFEIERGEVVGLIGPNGAGKTTAMQLILSLLEPTEGRIEVFGKNLMSHREEILSEMNFAAAYSSLPYNLTPYENLTVFALIYGIKNYKDKAKQLLEEFQLTKLMNNRSGGMSSGEQMRLSLAKAFLNNPKLLLLDEPTSSLDPAVAKNLRQKIYQKMEDIDGAVLWASHNMKEVETMCDRVIFLLKGKIIADDTPENLRKKFQKEDLEEIFFSLVE